MAVRKHDIDGTSITGIPGDESGVRLGNVVDHRDDASISAGFGRYGPGGSGSEVLLYDEVMVVTAGSLSVHDADGEVTGHPGDLVVMRKGTEVTYTAGPDGATFAFVTHPHWRLELGLDEPRDGDHAPTDHDG